jgi:hypothetical protein
MRINLRELIDANICEYMRTNIRWPKRASQRLRIYIREAKCANRSMWLTDSIFAKRPYLQADLRESIYGNRRMGINLRASLCVGQYVRPNMRKPIAATEYRRVALRELLSASQ